MIPDPDRIAFAGDWHADGQWAQHMIRIAAENDCQAIIHTGDFGFRFGRNFVHAVRHALTDTGVHLYFVRGNHDDPDHLARWPIDDDGFGTPLYGGTGAEYLHYIPQGHRWSWWNLTFMGLGGAHSVDRPWRTPYVDWWPGEWISSRDVDYAMRDGKVDIMITHDLPGDARLPNDRKSTYWPPTELAAAEQHRQILQAVVDQVQPELLVHGHFHQRYEQQVGGLHIVGLDMNGSAPNLNLYIIGPDLIERRVLGSIPL